MARKFKIGDKVKIVKCVGAEFMNKFEIGHIGIVTRYFSGSMYPYDIQNRRKKTGAFKPQELELVERKSK